MLLEGALCIADVALFRSSIRRPFCPIPWFNWSRFEAVLKAVWR